MFMKTNRRERRGVGFLALALLVALLCGGCLGMGQRMLPKDRLDYASAIADARKEQALHNVVRLRYSEFPSFIDLTQVVTSYSMLHQLAIKGLLKRPYGGSNDDISGVYTAQYAERPSMTYLPVGGSDFVRKLLTPLDMSVILSLVQTGWPADRLLEGLVISANGRVNRELQASVVEPADPEFTRFVRLMMAAQNANAMVVSSQPLSPEETAAIVQAASVAQAAAAAPSAAVRGAAMAALPPAPKLKIEICFWPESLPAEDRRLFEEVRGDLGLSATRDCYRVIAGDLAPDDRTLAVQTRSLMSFLMELAACVEVPAADLQSGAATRLGGSTQDALIRIRSGSERPPDPLVAIEHHGSWFWIDSDDDHSKRTFAYLSILLSITESGGGGAQLVVTTN